MSGKGMLTLGSVTALVWVAMLVLGTDAANGTMARGCGCSQATAEQLVCGCGCGSPGDEGAGWSGVGACCFCVCVERGAACEVWVPEIVPGYGPAIAIVVEGKVWTRRNVRPPSPPPRFAARCIQRTSFD